jgi:hypothetical protein
VRNGCDGTGCAPDDAEEDDFADELLPLDEGAPDEVVLEPGALDDGVPPRGPAPVPVPETCDAHAVSATHAANETAGRMRRARTRAYPAYGFALTSVTFIVFPLGVSYSTVSPSRAPVSALPSGEAAE